MIHRTETGARISSMRRKLGYSQAEFAELLNVSPQAVSKWETGLSLPDIDCLLNMSWIFKSSINHILEGCSPFENMAGIDREMLFLNSILQCPICRRKLTIKTFQESDPVFQCDNAHEFKVTDGVVDMVYLACDGSNLPISDESIDLVFSYGGYESMQAKMTGGVREAFRVLKNNGCSVCTKSAVEDFSSSNSITWMNLLLSSVNEEEAAWWKTEFIDINKWIDNSKEIGFAENTFTKIYGELPAPETNKFPFENEMAQWMAEYAVTSTKRAPEK